MVLTQLRNRGLEEATPHSVAYPIRPQRRRLGGWVNCTDYRYRRPSSMKKVSKTLAEADSPAKKEVSPTGPRAVPAMLMQAKTEPKESLGGRHAGRGAWSPRRGRARTRERSREKRRVTFPNLSGVTARGWIVLKACCRAWWAGSMTLTTLRPPLRWRVPFRQSTGARFPASDPVSRR